MNDLEFLDWMVNRLIHKHDYAESDSTIAILKRIKERLCDSVSCEIDDESLNNLLGHYYVGFNLEPSEDFPIGFSEKQREDLRNVTRSIVRDIVNKRKRQPIIKG